MLPAPASLEPLKNRQRSLPRDEVLFFCDTLFLLTNVEKAS